MAIAEVVDILQHQLFIQGDARDPLGVWVARHIVTGDASGSPIKVTTQVPAVISGSRIYTCYSITIAGLSGTILTSTAKIRLLTNFPDADLTVGVQGYGTVTVRGSYFTANNTLTAPTAGLTEPAIRDNDRFILLFGNQGLDTALLEAEIEQNVDGATYSFEAYGYFWDREVLYAPGGPRHPGSG